MASNPEQDGPAGTDTGTPATTEKINGTTGDRTTSTTGATKATGTTGATKATESAGATKATGATESTARTEVAEAKKPSRPAGSSQVESTEEAARTTPVTTTRKTEPVRDDLRERRQARTELELARANNRRLTDLGILVLRLIPLLVLIHGVGKLNNYSSFRDLVAQTPIGRPAPDLVAVLQIAAEVALPVALLLGILTRLSGLLLAISMGIVWTFAHFLPNAAAPISAQSALQGEPAMAFALTGLALFLTGGGRFAIDRLVMRRRIQARAERRAEKHV